MTDMWIIAEIVEGGLLLPWTTKAYTSRDEAEAECTEAVDWFRDTGSHPGLHVIELREVVQS